jgi:hypothetical protein
MSYFSLIIFPTKVLVRESEVLYNEMYRQFIFLYFMQGAAFLWVSFLPYFALYY